MAVDARGVDGGARTGVPPARLNTPADRFGRMFLDLPAFAAATDETRAALVDIGRPGGLLDARDNLALGPERLCTDPAQSLGNRDNPFQTAGTTFLGQFLDHDMTYETTSALGVPTSPESTRNLRTPALDLDSLYGGGPLASPDLYDGPRLRIESGGRFEDVPRRADWTAVLADPRNDDNLIISGLHAAFVLCHNRVVELLRDQGGPTGLFERARALVTWHYQWLIVHEFLPQIIGHGMTQDILGYGRRWYRPEPGPAYIPVEFQGAAYRFGHSMVRPSYRANGSFYGFVYDPDGGTRDLRGGRRAADRYVGWESFFHFGDGLARHTKRIDRKISTPLFRLPLVGYALPQRDLLRHLTWGLPSGQRVAKELGVPTLPLPELAPYGMARDSPLWYYVLAESELLSDGIALGPVGARIVGEVLIGLIQLDPRSYLHVQPDWRPTLPRRLAHDFKMTDLLRLAGVDPASRSAQRP